MAPDLAGGVSIAQKRDRHLYASVIPRRGFGRIVPGHPKQNGAHERMHRTLKAETARPPDQPMDRQQKRFDEFRDVYNNERPHEALGQKRPATSYRPSPRPYPDALPPIEYAGHLETRKVGQNGMMCWKNGLIFTSKTLRGGPILARRDGRFMSFASA